MFEIKVKNAEQLETLNYSDKLKEYTDLLICQSNGNDVTLRENHADEIIKIYNQIWEEEQNIPSISDLVDGVMTYNNAVLYAIAYYDFKCGFGTYGFHGCVDYLSSYGSEVDYVNEIADCWYNHFMFQIGCNLTEYIFDLSSMSGLSFVDDIGIKFINRNTLGLTLVVNDCQNLLLYEWQKISLSHVEEDYLEKISYIWRD